VFGVDIPSNANYTDAIAEETIEDFKCRRQQDLNRADLKTMRIFPALS